MMITKKLCAAVLSVGMAIPVVATSQEPARSTTTAAPASDALTKDQMKAQKKDQKAQEKAAKDNAKAAKDQAKSVRQQDKATNSAQKARASDAAAPATTTAPTAPPQD